MTEACLTSGGRNFYSVLGCSNRAHLSRAPGQPAENIYCLGTGAQILGDNREELISAKLKSTNTKSQAAQLLCLLTIFSLLEMSQIPE